MLTYNIFGSEDSVDCDVMVYVDQLPPTIEQSKKLCKFYDGEIQKELGTDKEVNSNLAIVRDGVITACFKGIPIETNNSVFLTAPMHEQPHPVKVKKRLPITQEWVLQKAARALRIVLCLLSRTQYRPEVKAALKGSTRQKMATLLSIDLDTIEDFGKNNDTNEDIYKNIAFQIGQSMALFPNISFGKYIELYTKEDIAKEFPLLSVYVKRTSTDAFYLNIMKDLFIYSAMGYMLSVPRPEYDLERIKE